MSETVSDELRGAFFTNDSSSLYNCLSSRNKQTFLGSPDTKAESISEIHILQNASNVFAKTRKDKWGFELGCGLNTRSVFSPHRKIDQIRDVSPNDLRA